MAQVTINEPTRDEMGMVFEAAIAGARTQRIRDLAMRVAAYHELKWQAQDKVAAAAKQQAQEPPPPAKEPSAGDDAGKAE